MTVSTGPTAQVHDAGRSVSDLARSEAPLEPTRAAALTLAIAEAADYTPPGIDVPEQLAPDTIHLEPDGSIRLTPTAGSYEAGPASTGAVGAAVGRAHHLLLVGRVPSDAADAFEPYLLSRLPATQCALIARSCSSSPAQWPGVTEWVQELSEFCGGDRLALPPERQRRERRSRRTARAAVALVVLGTAAVLWLAPRWLAASSEGSWPVDGDERPAQTAASSEMSY